MKFTAISAATVVATCLAAPVAATTITISDAPDTAAMMPVADATTGTVFENVTGSVFNVRLSAWHLCDCAVVEDASDAWYSSVNGGSSATYTFDDPVNAVSFLWGSPDVWNDLDLSLNGSPDTVTVNGLEVQGTPGIAAKYVTISGIGLFDTVTFRSTVNAFEYAALSAQVAAVPVPASFPLLLAGVGGVAWVARRRKARKSV